MRVDTAEAEVASRRGGGRGGGWRLYVVALGAGGGGREGKPRAASDGWQGTGKGGRGGGQSTAVATSGVWSWPSASWSSGDVACNMAATNKVSTL